jgi:RecB family exonuclease
MTEPLSATGLETLLGCPLRWVLHYRGGLRPGRGVDLPAGSRLLGTFAHSILEDLVLGEGALDVSSATPAEASAWAARAFDERVASRAAALVLPGNELEARRARDLVSRGAAALVGHLRAGGWRPAASELELSGTFEGVPATGKLDLFVEREGRQGILDLKLGNARYRRQALADGCAVQLAFYASLVAAAAGGELPPVGYLVLDDGQLLALDRALSPEASVVSGPSMAETLEAAREVWRYGWAALRAGVVVARHEELPGWAEAQERAVGRPPPGAQDRFEVPCRFCHFTTLCTARTGGGGVP